MSLQTNMKDFGPDGKQVDTSRDYERTLIRMAQRRSRRGYQMARFFMIGTVGASVLFVSLNFIQARANADLNSKLTDQVSSTYDPSYKVRFADLGAETIRAYYANVQAPVNVSQSITWPNMVLGNVTPSIQAASTPAAEDTATRLQIDNLTFLRGQQVAVNNESLPSTYRQEQLTYYALVNDIPFTIDITFGIDNADELSLPTLLSAPSIARADITGGQKLSTEPNGMSGVKLNSDQMTSQLTSWAKAWTTDDRNALKQVTKDDTTESVYVGLGSGWAYQDGLQVRWAKKVNENTAVAEVSFNIKVPDSTITEPARTIGGDPVVRTVTGPTQVQTMDVLVQDYDSGLPAIVAWGAAGSYDSLEPAMNAMDKKAAEAIPQAAPITEGTN